MSYAVKEVFCTLRGEADPSTDMPLDLRVLREQPDHRRLDKVEDLGPLTPENLRRFVHRGLARLSGLHVASVARNGSGARCVYRPASGV